MRTADWEYGPLHMFLLERFLLLMFPLVRRVIQLSKGEVVRLALTFGVLPKICIS